MTQVEFDSFGEEKDMTKVNMLEQQFENIIFMTFLFISNLILTSENQIKL